MAQAEQFLSRGYQGVVSLRDTDAGRVVVKQAMGRGFALWLRRVMLRREFAAYQRLGDVPGVPRCLGMEADRRLLLEFLEGEPFRESGCSADRSRPRFSVSCCGPSWRCMRPVLHMPTSSAAAIS